ncbi:MAG: 1-acyl-sn-glycerol-3-phosphate acyltransferase [Syntrophales bacterium]|jgi:1-acyl-sn-glycerol-3-phosphate acyltransferase|nr:1-acyl-sn-glycerol-3-phosphate acyltransferase [Syntrophales bacterium]MDD4340482.1 lysophospholipid acyltransferase family protein [Syntrophales bacterium]HOG07614.1 lysophospholipid acyltransferase family protein [Syntrophales bacterium]HOS77631.1 lysophospholipid acyltransferase family protein [Syntrophales bacterium]HPB70723.1 lysophospholipid acyltransferase family protein [Syntrophales bacterium]
MTVLLRLAKTLWIYFWAILSSLLLFVPICLAAFFSRTGNLAFNLSQLWAWIMLKVTCVRVMTRGRDKIRQGQSYIIIANHASVYDILALVTGLRTQYRWIIKKELLRVPLFGYALYASRNIFIDRADPARAITSIHKALDRLPAGVSVLFFAEGTRSPDGRIRPFKKGGFVMAVEKGLPILPVTINGSRGILPKKSVAFNPGTVEVVVGDPIATEGEDRDHLEALIERTRNVIIANYRSGEQALLTGH